VPLSWWHATPQWQRPCCIEWLVQQSHATESCYHQVQIFCWKHSKSSKKGQQQEQWLFRRRVCASFKRTKLFQAKMFPWDITTGQIKRSWRGKGLAGKEATLDMKIESRRGILGCKRAIRRGSAEDKVRKHWHCVTGASRHICTQTRRVDVSYDSSMATALQQGTWMDNGKILKGHSYGYREKGKSGSIHQLNFMLTWLCWESIWTTYKCWEGRARSGGEGTEIRPDTTTST